VAVTNTPAGVRRPVATAILALVLAVTGRLTVKERLARQGPAGWAQVTRHNGVGLTGKTVGTLGLGNIARDMVRLMTPLDVRFLAHDPYANAAAAATLNVELVGIEDLFRRSDILCVNTPLTPETRRLVSAGLIALMKPTAYLINTARGGVVDQAALTAALREGRIAGAGLDVFEKEPLPADDPILQLDNVVVTPHALCWTDELYAGCGRECLGYVVDVMEGRVPAALLNRDVLQHPRWSQGG
jgi:phosphoglycerate dehydrogenase-like enzyme